MSFFLCILFSHAFNLPAPGERDYVLVVGTLTDVLHTAVYAPHSAFEEPHGLLPSISPKSG